MTHCMGFLCIIIAGSVFLAMSIMLIVHIAIQKSKLKKAKHNDKIKEDSALKGIEAGICEQLHTTHPGSKWRWVCRPAGFAVNGGIARIDVINPCGKQCFIDVCYSAENYAMTLHVLNTVELMAEVQKASGDKDTFGADDGIIWSKGSESCTAPTSAKNIKPYDEESVVTWYNIVLIGALTDLIGDLNAKGEICLYISRDGKVYADADEVAAAYESAGSEADEGDKTAVIYDFGEMPDMALWSHIIDRLGDDGLFAEVREIHNEDCVFISWA